MSTTAALRPTTGRTVLLGVTRVLFGLFGTLKLAGTAYFTFVASAEQGGDPQGLGDWSVVVWSTVLGVVYLVVAVRLGSAGRAMVPLVAGLAAVDTIFSVVKLTVYDEPEAMGFLATTLVLLALVIVATRERRTA
jgi:hypothetical protein